MTSATRMDVYANSILRRKTLRCADLAFPDSTGILAKFTYIYANFITHLSRIFFQLFSCLLAFRLFLNANESINERV